MAIAFDAVSSTVPGTGALSWLHTPIGTPKGVIVFVVQNVGTADEVTGVTYGGVTMTEVTGSPNLHTTGEPGGVHAFFLGSSIPTGDQTISVSVNGTGSSKAGIAISVTAAANTEINDVDATINSDAQADPSVTLQLNGISSFCCIGFHSGQNAPTAITPLTNWTTIAEVDFGSQTSGFYRYNTIGTADVTAGWTQTSEDAAAIAIAIDEVGSAPAGQPTVKRQGGVAFMSHGGYQPGSGRMQW